jgi:hypothetical protein
LETPLRPGGFPDNRSVEDKPLMDKLGVKPDMRVAVLGVDDPSFEAALRARVSDVGRRRRKKCDLVFLAAETNGDLERLRDLRGDIKPDGAIWVVRRKGKQATLTDVQVIEAGLAARMVDNKIASFSETHGAMRLVIRLVDR